MTFHELQRRLVAYLHERVRNGEVTERGLARLTGISQPHIHHVLKGKRTFSITTADQILRHLRLDVLDLLDPNDLLEWRHRD
jgi:predicted transcriptional regulator